MGFYERNGARVPNAATERNGACGMPAGAAPNNVASARPLCQIARLFGKAGPDAQAPGVWTRVAP